MDLELAGKTALVTAASRGFGRAVALGLAAAGARVAICARGAEDLDEAAAAVTAAGQGRVLARSVDVCNGEAVSQFVSAVEDELGPIELCLVNAGGPPAAAWAELELADWETAYRLIVESSLRLCRLILPGMRKRGFGRIVQITSVAVRQPVEDLILSNVMRPAVHALTKNLALAAAADGVTINTVAPGFHLTSAVERLIVKKMDQEGISREEVLNCWRAQIPAGRLGTAEELAALVLFLMSQQAGYITGQLIVADGGWVRGTF